MLYMLYYIGYWVYELSVYMYLELKKTRVNSAHLILSLNAVEPVGELWYGLVNRTLVLT